MNERDLLERAADAWREQHSGAYAKSGLSRAQILDQLRKKRRRWLGWWCLSPVAVLVGGSAWAEATDAWPEALQPVRAGVVHLAQSLGLSEAAPRKPSPAPSAAAPSAAAPSAAAPSAAAPSAAPREAGDVTEVEGSTLALGDDGAGVEEMPLAHPADEAQAVGGNGAAPEPAAGVSAAGESASARRAASAAGVSAAGESASVRGAESAAAGVSAAGEAGSGNTENAGAVVVEPKLAVAAASRRRSKLAAAESPPNGVPRDPELAALRRAHDAHFMRGELQGARRAYQEYLAQYPSGRFVPEARYNLALLQLRLGEPRRAKQQLEAFARGDYGEYRKTEAKALLEALEAAGRE